MTSGELEKVFGSIGIIKNDRKRGKAIIIFMNKETNTPKGDATVRYEDAYTAPSAVKWFDGTAFMGNTIHVEMAGLNFSLCLRFMLFALCFALN